MRVATYNIQSADYGKSIKEISKEIKELGIELIGFQEIDDMTNRSGKVNVLEEICGKDFPYFVYVPTMDFDGGRYGIGMASVYPIKLIKTVKHETAELEPRVLMICELDINGKKLYAANTHLSYENADIRVKQFEAVENELKDLSPIILFGDFNITSFDEYKVLSLNKVNSEETPIKSFKYEIPFRCIDNIFYGNDIEITNATLNNSESSDHNMIWADIKIQ